jgi:hypothetical protein
MTYEEDTAANIRSYGSSFLFYGYIFVSIVLGLGGLMYLVRANRSAAGITYLTLAILIFVFYGQRWFRGTQSIFSYTGTWPPVINMCPDYLVYYKEGTGQDICIDMVGMSQNGALQVATPEDIRNLATTTLADNKKFPFTYKPGMTADQLKNLCDATRAAGLTWEGVTNGESCTYASSSASSATAAAAAAGCPVAK